MTEQNYANHRRFVPMYHYVALLLIIALLLGSFVNLYRTVKSGEGVYSASLIVVLIFVSSILYYYLRAFALRAQDRLIRLEENFRHYLMNGKLLDAKLTIRQIIGLRFASDGEFMELEKRAAAENLSEDDIKKAVKNWKGDYYRV
jgi:hypothetical protein